MVTAVLGVAFFHNSEVSRDAEALHPGEAITSHRLRALPSTLARTAPGACTRRRVGEVAAGANEGQQRAGPIRENDAVVTDPARVSGSIRGRPPGVREATGLFLDERDGPLPALLLALTVLAGVVDATSILRLGHVFVATMTGNLVFIGLAAAGARGFAVGKSALALGGFVVGLLIGGRACQAARSHRGRALRNVLAVKLWLAGVVALVTVVSGSRLHVGTRNAIILLLAMSMGAQLAAIRYLKVPDLLTVVLTMTLTCALTERTGGWSDPKVLRRILTLVAFAVGALSGALVILNGGLVAGLFFGYGILVAVAVAVAAHLVSHTSASWSAPRS